MVVVADVVGAAQKGLIVGLELVIGAQRKLIAVVVTVALWRDATADQRHRLVFLALRGDVGRVADPEPRLREAGIGGVGSVDYRLGDAAGHVGRAGILVVARDPEPAMKIMGGIDIEPAVRGAEGV